MVSSVTVHTAALLVLVVIFCSWSYVAAEGEDCCLATTNKKIPARLVKSYFLQTTSMGCRTAATVFTTKMNKKLCAPLPKNKNWVQGLINKLNKKSKKTRKSKGKKQ
ncbi:C-C motif chemokine 19b [Astyanax mexicanus]|uniref:C-C motif chemokine 19-like n=2 Tax=Astyanax mexicanus TaxID=7994 RepID=A0A8T2L2S2_ASTMX|nr:C-C motif chemokine 19b [Astyanax mexicanus]KAG9263311.1 C-C motif chemokine 19-like [Astyanax mexicanus]